MLLNTEISYKLGEETFQEQRERREIAFPVAMPRCPLFDGDGSKRGGPRLKYEFSVLVAGGGWERRQMICCSRWRDEVADPATAELLLLCCGDM